MIKVSVVIPMYNAKAYIVECIRALLRQTLDDIEIIIVDDCSTDGSFELCRDVFASNTKVTVIQQEANGGPGKARNLGIDTAKGEYIAFVDSDDALLTNALEEMYITAKKMNADLLHTGGVLVPFKKDLPVDLTSLPEENLLKVLLDKSNNPEPVYITDDIKQRVDEWMDHCYHWNVWSKLFKRSMLLENNIRFKDISISEDKNFCFNCLLHAENYVKVMKFYYIYRISTDSLSRGKTTPKFMRRVMQSLINLPVCMSEVMETSPFFKDNPEYVDIINNFCINSLEKGYGAPRYKELGREAVMNSPEILSLFEETFGYRAKYILKLFCDAHENMPVKAQIGQMNDYSFWEKMKENADENGVISII